MTAKIWPGQFALRPILVAAALALAPGLALAYIDPGNGAYMVQALFTLVGAGLFYVRHPIRSIKAVWQRLTNKSASPEPVAANDPNRPDNRIAD